MFIKKKELEYIVGCIDDMKNDIDYLHDYSSDLEYKLNLAEERIALLEKAKVKETSISDKEQRRRDKIMKDIQVIQDYSLEDVLEYIRGE